MRCNLRQLRCTQTCYLVRVETVNLQVELRRALQRIKQAHPGAKVEGLHVDYMNGFGCDFAACMMCQMPGCTQANLTIFASVSSAHASFDSTIVTAPVGRNIADCAEEFKRRQLPLHGLINNIGVENPYDNKSKEGFDVRSASCYNLIPCMYPIVMSQHDMACCSLPKHPTTLGTFT